MREGSYFFRVSFVILCLVGGALADVTADTSTFIDDQGRKVTIIRETESPVSPSVKSISTSSSQNVTLVETAPNTAEVDSVRIYQYQIDRYRKLGKSRQSLGVVFLVIGGTFVGGGVAAIGDGETGSGGIVCIAIGSIGLITSLPIILTGSAQTRKANRYQEKLDLYKMTHPRSKVTLQATPILDPVKGRGGVLLALNF